MKHFPRHARWLALQSTLIVLAALLAAVPTAGAQSAERHHFDIPAQDLGKALTLLGQQAEREIVFAADITRGKHSVAVQGDLTVREALEKVLAGSGLSYRLTSTGPVVVEIPFGPSGEHGASSSHDPPSSSVASDSATGARLEDVVVTARKRAESVQSVPTSISVLTAEDLSRRGVTDLRDLAAALPGVNLSGYEPDRMNISIRGVTTGTYTPTVAVYVDDVPISSTNSDFSGQPEPPLFDTQRVEVLKGPQGTLYGGGAMGGAIKFVSNPANPNHEEFLASAGVASTESGANSYQGSAVANLPIVQGVLAVRIGGAYTEQGGFVDRVPGAEGTILTLPGGIFQSFNSTLARNINTYETAAARVSVAYTPSEALSVALDLNYQDRHADDTGQFWPNLPAFEQSNVIAEPISDRLVFPILTIKGNLGAMDLTSISGYVDRRRDETREFTFFVGALVPPFASLPSPSVIISPITNLTEELRLSTSDANAPLKLITGLYLQRESFEYDQDVLTIGSGAGLPGLPKDEVFQGRTATVTKQGALFGDATYAFTQNLEATLGARVFHVSQQYTNQGNGIFNGGPTSYSSSGSDSGVSPKAELSYHFSPDHLGYILADKGFRPGSGNSPVPVSNCAADLAALGLTQAPPTNKSDSLWNYEIGTKNTFADGAIVVNGALFYIDWSNIQQQVTLPHCGFDFFANLGAAVVKGGELELRASPIRGLTFDISATYADAYITKASFGTQGQVGDPVEASPKFVANANVEYRIPLGADVFGFARADYQWHGSQTAGFNRTITSDVDPFTGIQYPSPRTIADPTYLQSSYDIVNIALGAVYHRWTARLYLDNATNERPLLSVNGGGGQTTAYTLRPRTVGLTVSTGFN